MLQHETLGTRNSCLLEARGSVFQKQAPVQSCAGSFVHLWLHNSSRTQGLAGGYVLHHCWSSMSGPRSVHRGQRSPPLKPCILIPLPVNIFSAWPDPSPGHVSSKQPLIRGLCCSGPAGFSSCSPEVVSLHLTAPPPSGPNSIFSSSYCFFLHCPLCINTAEVTRPSTSSTASFSPNFFPSLALGHGA